jgi:hypothetical protein
MLVWLEMAEVEITKGTVVLLTATILMFSGCIIGLVMYNGNEVFLLTLAGPILGVLATFSAATDRNMSDYDMFAGSFQQGRYLGESCAALTFGFVAVGINAIFLFIFGLILSDGFDANMFLVTMILLLGTVLTAVGAYVAWTEWQG